MSFDIIIPFLKPIQHLLESGSVSEIMVNPDGTIWIEEQGHIEPVPGIRFEDGALLTALEVIANRFDKKLDADLPIMNLRLPDGSRLAATIPPIVHPQPLMTIRRFTSRNFTMDDLIERKMLTADQAGILTGAVRHGETAQRDGRNAEGHRRRDRKADCLRGLGGAVQRNGLDCAGRQRDVEVVVCQRQ